MSDFSLTERLWLDKRISMWEATGSESMGKALTSKVGPSFRRMLLELGGNNAVIIHKDANFSNAIESCLFSSSGTAGQRCTSTRMIFVHQDLHKKFIQELALGYKNKLNIGDPFQAGVNVGPVHHRRQVKHFLEGVQHYLKQGSELLVGGKAISANFVEPTVFLAPTLHYDPLLEERFSPIVHVIKYGEDQLDDVIDEINRSGYGLSGGVFTNDKMVFEKCAQEIKVGILNQNYGSSGAEAGENFGGEGRTGNCRMLGPLVFNYYTRYINSMRAPFDSEIVHAQGVTMNAEKK
jgi:acyl-CoA reductase-like NAD-dependent aldehyde dehydrogenase